MDLNSISKIEQASRFSRVETLRFGLVMVFIIGVMMFTHFNIPDVPGRILLVIAAVIGGYMALNIGANDVANNVGPAVGSKALTLVGAIIIAGIFEASGALIAGGDVVSTIKKGIIDPAMIKDSGVFIWLMMAALLAGALWLNIATALGAPVSTTHSIVGGVLGAGIAAGGWGIVNWDRMAAIASSWVISPVLGGVIAATFLYFIKHAITYKDDKNYCSQTDCPLIVIDNGLVFFYISGYERFKRKSGKWSF